MLLVKKDMCQDQMQALELEDPVNQSALLQDWCAVKGGSVCAKSGGNIRRIML